MRRQFANVAPDDAQEPRHRGRLAGQKPRSARPGFRFRVGRRRYRLLGRDAAPEALAFDELARCEDRQSECRVARPSIHNEPDIDHGKLRNYVADTPSHAAGHVAMRDWDRLILLISLPAFCSSVFDARA